MDKSSTSLSGNNPFPSSSSSASGMSTDGATQRVNQAGTALHDTIDKMAEPARNTVDRAASAAHSTVDRVASSATGIAGKIVDQAKSLTDKPLQAVDYSKAYIKEHPLQAVGAALVVGLVIGRLTASRY